MNAAIAARQRANSQKYEEAQGIVDSQSDTNSYNGATEWIDNIANAVVARLCYGDANEWTETPEYADVQDQAAEIIRQGVVKGVLNALASIPAREAETVGRGAL